MSYVGNTPTQQAFTPAVDYFSGNGANTAFTLSRPVASAAQVEVIVNNVVQNPSTAYTVNGNTVTFTGAPSAGTNNIYVRYTSPITQVIQPGQGTVGTSALVDAAVTTAKIADANITASKLAAGQVLSLNGVAFPSTQVASSDANTLDDYEEGTWTPSIGGTATYTSRSGRYTKVGNLVTVFYAISVNVIGTGSIYGIQNLPFVSAAGITQFGPTGNFTALNTSLYYLYSYTDPASNSINFGGTSSLGTGSGAPQPIFKSGASVAGQFSYFVD